MSAAALPKPMSSAAAVGLLVAVLGLAALAAVTPYTRIGAVRQEATAMRELIAQRERFLLAAAGRPAQGGREALLAGESSGVLAAELQRHLTELARRNNMSLRSTQVVAAKREPYLTAVALELNLQGDTAGLRSLLHAVETGMPVLFVEKLAVKLAAARETVPSAAAYKPQSLDISLKVRGYGVGREAN